MPKLIKYASISILTTSAIWSIYILLLNILQTTEKWGW